MSSAARSSEVLQERHRWGALVTLFLAPAFIFANMYTTQAILPVLSRDFHISAPAAGLTVSLLVLAVAIGSLFYGPLSDRIGRKRVMVGASFLVLIPTLLCGFAPNFAVLVVLRAMQGLLMPGLTGLYDWRIAMEVFALPTLIAALFMWRFLPETNSRKNIEAKATARPGA